MLEVVRSRIEADLGLEEHAGRGGLEVVMVNRLGVEERVEAVINGVGIVACGDAADRADRRQAEFALRCAVGREEGEPALGDDLIINQDAAAGQRRVLDNAFALRHDDAPVGGVGLVEAGGDNAALGRAQRGPEE